MDLVVGHIEKLICSGSISEFAKGHFTKGLFAAANLQRGILQKGIFMQSFCDSEFAAGLCVILQRGFAQNRLCNG